MNTKTLMIVVVIITIGALISAAFIFKAMHFN